ncbi:MAG: NADH-quinone oxidoreductase subunit C [Desulfuromonadia bacterium]
MKGIAKVVNGGAVPLSALTPLATDDFLTLLVDRIGAGQRVVAYFGVPAPNGLQLVAVIGDAQDGTLSVATTIVTMTGIDSLAVVCPQLQLFEREIAEQYGLVFDAHPWFKPVRFHESYGDRDAWGRPRGVHPRVGVMEYYRVEGEEIHEVAVGPVHAGIIEPGHFRFQCHGEVVFHLEISLGYQHRGVEPRLAGVPTHRSAAVAETIAGDTTIGHTVAWAMVLESLSRRRISPRAEVIRGVALELERLANHTGDLGAIAGDVGYLPTASFCGRIRGDFLNMTALICGSRFGRGLVRPGGVLFDLEPERAATLRERLSAAFDDLSNAVDLLWSTPSVMARLEGTGTVTSRMAVELGLVGPAARACGVKRDVRHDFPAGIFRMTHLPVATAFHGDVCSRAMIRWQEIQKSVEFIADQLNALPRGEIHAEPGGLQPESIAVSLVEGWRGEICHVAITDAAGGIARYKVVDPSFHNWMGLAMALRGEQISDFPLCNKSFNLSYCGYDL